MTDLALVTGLRDMPARPMLAAVGSIGANIRQRRIAAGFQSQGEFAAKIGERQARVSDWERGRYAVPDLDTLIAIAKALACGLDDLVAGVDAEYDKSRSDPARHTRTGTSSAHGAATSRLLQELEHAHASAREAAAELRTIADALDGAAAKTQRPAARKAGGGTAGRKHDRQTA